MMPVEMPILAARATVPWKRARTPSCRRGGERRRVGDKAMRVAEAVAKAPAQSVVKAVANAVVKAAARRC